jgi:hypothetical protein
MLLPKILAAGGLLFAFEQSTIAGKIVLALLAVVSIFSWSIMITKLRVVQFARKQAARFRAAFRKDRQPLRLFENHAKFPGAPLFNVYRAGCEEMTFQLLGSAEVDETFRARLGEAEKITPAQMHAVNAAMERAVGETALGILPLGNHNHCARDLGLPLVCTNDVHYLKNSDFKPHDILLCIGTGKSVNDENRLKYHGDQFFLKTAEQMAAVFGAQCVVLAIDARREADEAGSQMYYI